MKLLDGELTNSFDSECAATRDILSLVGDTWSVLIIVNLGKGPVRFNELKRTLRGVSQRMLTFTLRGLERDGLISRTVYPTKPPRVDYELTVLGRSLLAPVIALAAWAQSNRQEIMIARANFHSAQRKS